MTAPNDPTVFERVKVLGGALLVAAHDSHGFLPKLTGMLHGQGTGHLQFGIFLGSYPDLKDNNVRNVLGQAATYVDTHGLAKPYPVIKAYTYEHMARWAVRFGFQGSQLMEGQVPQHIVDGIAAERAAYTADGRAGKPMGPVFALQQPTQQFVDNYLPPQAA